MPSRSFQDWGVLFLISVTGTFAYFSNTKALQMIDPTIVSVLRSMEIVLAFVLQVSLMGMMPSGLDLTGAGCVIVGVVMISLEKIIVQRLPAAIQRWL